jgi:RNase P/RNase MRP subunit POP5
MTVKEKRGRRRYVYFESADGKALPHEDMLQSVINTSAAAGARSIKLIQFDGRRGIVRCALTELDALLGAVNADGRPFHTLCTSGTVRTLREKYFPDQLQKRPRDGGSRQ